MTRLFDLLYAAGSFLVFVVLCPFYFLKEAALLAWDAIRGKK
jgi:hypothetical protein